MLEIAPQCMLRGALSYIVQLSELLEPSCAIENIASSRGLTFLSRSSRSRSKSFFALSISRAKDLHESETEKLREHLEERESVKKSTKMRFCRREVSWFSLCEHAAILLVRWINVLLCAHFLYFRALIWKMSSNLKWRVAQIPTQFASNFESHNKKKLIQLQIKIVTSRK